MLRLDTRLAVAAGVGPGDVLRTEAIELDQAYGYWRTDLQECARALDLIAADKASSVRDVLLAFPQDRRHMLQLGLMWMAKQGFIDWLD